MVKNGVYVYLKPSTGKGYKKVIALAFIIGMTMSGCGKKGCTDIDATNYDPNATKNNNTCKYEGSIIVWTKPPYSNVNMYLDGTYLGELTDMLTSAPSNCSSSNAFKITRDLGSVKSKSFRFKGVVNQNSSGPANTWEEDITFKANTCLPQELK